jgi:hypothetical protein
LAETGVAGTGATLETVPTLSGIDKILKTPNESQSPRLSGNQESLKSRSAGRVPFRMRMTLGGIQIRVNRRLRFLRLLRVFG